MTLPKENIDVLSLFNGMGCIWLALDQLGVTVGKRYVSEVDKFANQANDHNYPATIHLGDVQKVNGKVLGHIDLLVGGSPCQGFSMAGKGLNFNDPRSKLFFEFVRILKECRATNPNLLFLLENVEMKKEHENVITSTLGVPPIKINSALVSAQNRERLYWTNINLQPDGMFGEMRPSIPQPKDRHIYIKDILKDNVPDKYLVSPKALKRMFGKKYSLPQISPSKTGAFSCKNNSSQLAGDSGTTLISVYNTKGKLKTNQTKASALTIGGHGAGNHSDMDIICQNKPVQLNPEQNNFVGCVKIGRSADGKQARKESMAKGKDHTPFQAKQINGIDFEKTNCITAALYKDTILFNNIHGTFRRLTPVECCRLQTVPDNYFYDQNGKQIVSDTQIYKMTGNGWTVDVIAHILSFAF